MKGEWGVGREDGGVDGWCGLNEGWRVNENIVI